MNYDNVHADRAHQQLANAMMDVLNGTEGAWDKLNSLIDRFLEKLRYQHAFKFCIWISGEDVLQHLKLKIHKTLSKINAICEDPEVKQETVMKLAQSVKRMSRQAISDQKRRLKGDDKTSIRNVRLDEEGMESSGIAFTEDSTAYEIVLVNEVMSNLTDEEREVIFLCVIEGMSLREAGAELGLDKNKVSRIRTEALRKLVKKVI